MTAQLAARSAGAVVRRVALRARTVLGIDPGSEQSAWLVYNPDDGVCDFALEPNAALLARIRQGGLDDVDVVAIEKVESYGMAVGREVFDTVHWAGRFTEAIESRAMAAVVQLPRRAVKVAICGDTKAKDTNIRLALLDRFGAQGTKAAPGPLYGIVKDIWSALAVAVTQSDAEVLR